MRALLAAVLALAASDALGATQPDTRALQAAVAAELRDPGAAQFRGVRVVATTPAGVNVCGEVNGRNAMGGYAGFQPFFAEVINLGRSWKAVVTLQDAAGPAYIRRMCNGG